VTISCWSAAWANSGGSGREVETDDTDCLSSKLGLTEWWSAGVSGPPLAFELTTPPLLEITLGQGS